MSCGEGSMGKDNASAASLKMRWSQLSNEGKYEGLSGSNRMNPVWSLNGLRVHEAENEKQVVFILGAHRV